MNKIVSMLNLLPNFKYKQLVRHPIHGFGFVQSISLDGILVEFKSESSTTFTKLFKVGSYSPGDDLITHIDPQ